MATAEEVAMEQRIVNAGKTGSRVKPDHIDDLIVAVVYKRGIDFLDGDPIPISKTTDDALNCTTICLLVLKNGFVVEGISACADPQNYDAAIGRDLAYQNARKKIWALEGYQLRSKLAGLL